MKGLVGLFVAKPERHELLKRPGDVCEFDSGMWCPFIGFIEFYLSICPFGTAVLVQKQFL